MAERNGGSGPDRLKGTGGADTLRGFDGNDRLFGRGGDDSLFGGRGDDLLDGGGGFDRVRYIDDPGGVVVNLATGRARDGYGGTDRLVGIERVIGSSFDDVLRGSDRDESFSGGVSDDRIVGGGGRDHVFYADATAGLVLDLAAGTATGEGDDRLFEIEMVTGSNFSDTLLGSGADNLFVPDWDGDPTTPNALVGGDDVIDGRGGTDTVDYGNAIGGVSVHLNLTLNGGRVFDALGNTDRLTNVEVVIGSRFRDDMAGGAFDCELRGGNAADVLEGGIGDDRLFGEAGADVMSGGGGTDVLFGGGGADEIDGTFGNDWLTGGKGADTFVYFAGRDTITDFRDDADSIELAGILAEGRSARQILSENGRMEGEDAILDFGVGTVLRIEGVGGLAALRDDLFLL